MRAGTLRHKLTLQQVTETPNSFGEPEETWAIFAAVRGSVEPLSGEERLIAQQPMAEVTHRVRIRFLKGVTSKLRILLGTRTLEIAAVIDVEERHRELELLCKELAPET